MDTAVAAGSFTTLATALTAAGLVETLKTSGPFTVFAPTDEAFAKIPAETLNAIIADKQKLASILTYHVVSGKVAAADVIKVRHGARSSRVDVGAPLRRSIDRSVDPPTQKIRFDPRTPDCAGHRGQDGPGLVRQGHPG